MVGKFYIIMHLDKPTILSDMENGEMVPFAFNSYEHAMEESAYVPLCMTYGFTIVEWNRGILDTWRHNRSG